MHLSGDYSADYFAAAASGASSLLRRPSNSNSLSSPASNASFLRTFPQQQHTEDSSLSTCPDKDLPPPPPALQTRPSFDSCGSLRSRKTVTFMNEVETIARPSNVAGDDDIMSPHEDDEYVESRV